MEYRWTVNTQYNTLYSRALEVNMNNALSYWYFHIKKNGESSFTKLVSQYNEWAQANTGFHYIYRSHVDFASGAGRSTVWIKITYEKHTTLKNSQIYIERIKSNWYSTHLGKQVSGYTMSLISNIITIPDTLPIVDSSLYSWYFKPCKIRMG